MALRQALSTVHQYDCIAWAELYTSAQLTDNINEIFVFVNNMIYIYIYIFFSIKPSVLDICSTLYILYIHYSEFCMHMLSIHEFVSYIHLQHTDSTFSS